MKYFVTNLLAIFVAKERPKRGNFCNKNVKIWYLYKYNSNGFTLFTNWYNKSSYKKKRVHKNVFSFLNNRMDGSTHQSSSPKMCFWKNLLKAVKNWLHVLVIKILIRRGKPVARCQNRRNKVQGFAKLSRLFPQCILVVCYHVVHIYLVLQIKK